MMSVQSKTGLALLREPFPANQISKLPKPTKKQTEDVRADHKKGIRCQVCGAWHHPDVVHLDYVGHAALTDRLLDTDPEWTWEPVATPEALGLPIAPGGMWIRLKVCNVTRLGFGFADGKSGGDAVKEIIGDALRNAAMRFGAALDLWHKGQLHEDESEEKKFPSPVAALAAEIQTTPEASSRIQAIANSFIDLVSADPVDDYKVWELYEPLSSDDRILVWNELKDHSRVRSKVKTIAQEQSKK